MVRLRDSLSNPNKQLKRLLAAMNNRGGVASLLDSAEAARAELIAQTGAEDPASVRLIVKENRKLAAFEVAELVAAYEAGASQRGLARRFGLHEQTVRTHLRRQGLTLRPVRVLEGVLADEAVRLYVNEQLSLVKVGRRLGVSPDAVRRLLRQRGVPRRPKTVRGR